MARKLKLEVGAINIRLHPHSDQRYRDLFQRLFEIKQVVNIRGDRSGLMTSLQRIRNDADYINGVITTFLEFDVDGKWLNTDTLEEASDNELQKINIPENLRPNSRPHLFQFDVKNHELIFEHYANGNRLTHNAALSFIKGLLNDKRIVQDFGDVKATIVQSKGSIDRIFSIPRITDIEIYIEKPNADIWGEGFEEQAEEHLDDKNARSMTISYKAEQGLGIVRDQDLSRLVGASIRNGRTIAKGYGKNGHEVVTTDSYPKVVQDKYDEEVMSQPQMFELLARRFRRG
ncbi:DUF4747 family protein [Sphingomonas sp. BGYR3]|uniref:DUF4747 family protein n=1 Tax=Sphingomonas sp. BGYR3 TaxID=2975483 RepID=UPI0021A27544|nr:DUF4747 family protein [Sphingomonas sp. BGYR3]MDG5488258.1 DUF4747 family protein [Sphingomonas sp. BGYR3]